MSLSDRGRGERKTIFTLNIDNYAPQITAITYPLIRFWADKIGADFHIITERKFPGWPVVYEKLQIHTLGRDMENDWNIFVDSDALIHPETIDFTLYLHKDTVAHNGNDMANIRWKYDRYFRRDGRNIGSCNWMTAASDWCLDLWRPLDDLTLAEAVKNIYPVVGELNTVITADHLIDDYTLSRNIARFGLKFKNFGQILTELGLDKANFFWHLYTITIEEKAKQMLETLETWKIPDDIRHYGK